MFFSLCFEGDRFKVQIVDEIEAKQRNIKKKVEQILFIMKTMFMATQKL